MFVVQAKLTVFFEEPFWVGVYERRCAGRMEAARVVFGAEPKDYDVYGLLLHRQAALRFSPSVEAAEQSEAPTNPKRMQRKAARAMAQTDVGTKAQQALKLQHDENKLARQTRSKQEREAEEERRFQLRQDKRKQKHSGH